MQWVALQCSNTVEIPKHDPNALHPPIPACERCTLNGITCVYKYIGPGTIRRRRRPKSTCAPDPEASRNEQEEPIEPSTSPSFEPRSDSMGTGHLQQFNPSPKVSDINYDLLNSGSPASPSFESRSDLSDPLHRPNSPPQDIDPTLSDLSFEPPPGSRMLSPSDPVDQPNSFLSDFCSEFQPVSEEQNILPMDDFGVRQIQWTAGSGQNIFDSDAFAMVLEHFSHGPAAGSSSNYFSENIIGNTAFTNFPSTTQPLVNTNLNDGK